MNSPRLYVFEYSGRRLQDGNAAEDPVGHTYHVGGCICVSQPLRHQRGLLRQRRLGSQDRRGELDPILAR